MGASRKDPKCGSFVQLEKALHLLCDRILVEWKKVPSFFPGCGRELQRPEAHQLPGTAPAPAQHEEAYPCVGRAALA